MMRIAEPLRYWLKLPSREGFQEQVSWSTFARYAPLMLAATLPFLLVEVQQFTGLSFGKVLAFALLHMMWNAAYIVFGTPSFAHMENALFTAVLPVLAAPYEPLAWTFFVLSAANDAVICMPSRMHGVYVAVVPWLTLLVCYRIYGGAHMTIGSVALVSIMSGVIYLWLAEMMGQFDRLVEENHQLRSLEGIREERERISRDVHDGLGSTLTGLALRCEVATDAIDHNPVLAKRTLAEIAEFAREALRRVRLSVRSFVGKAVTPAEFHGLLRNVANDVCAGRCEIILVTESEQPLSPELSYNLLLLAAEALTNAIRHGEAKQIVFRFHWAADCWDILVRDNGRGLQDNAAELRTINHRVKRLGGRVDFQGLPGGTQLRVLSAGCVHTELPLDTVSV